MKPRTPEPNRATARPPLAKWRWIALFAFSIGIAVLLSTMVARRQPGDDRPSISELTYEEINRAIASRFASAELEEYSRQLKGTGVRWTGQVAAIDSEGRVFILMGRSPSSNVEFQLPQSVARRLRKDSLVTFTGKISRLSAMESFPPMPGVYVRLENVKVEESGPAMLSIPPGRLAANCARDHFYSRLFDGTQLESMFFTMAKKRSLLQSRSSRLDRFQHRS